MAPLPPNSTARVKVFYQTCGFNHTCLIRYKAPNTVADVIVEFNALVTALAGTMFLSSFIGAQDSAILSDVFNDVAGDWPVTWGQNNGPKVATANYYDFVGRSNDGRRVRFSLFGAKDASFGDDYRALTTERVEIDNAVQVLNDAEGVFLSINGFQPVWKSYANMGVNAYWRNHIR